MLMDVVLVVVVAAVVVVLLNDANGKVRDRTTGVKHANAQIRGINCWGLPSLSVCSSWRPDAFNRRSLSDSVLFGCRAQPSYGAAVGEEGADRIATTNPGQTTAVLGSPRGAPEDVASCAPASVRTSAPSQAVRPRNKIVPSSLQHHEWMKRTSSTTTTIQNSLLLPSS